MFNGGNQSGNALLKVNNCRYCNYIDARTQPSLPHIHNRHNAHSRMTSLFLRTHVDASTTEAVPEFLNLNGPLRAHNLYR